MRKPNKIRQTKISPMAGFTAIVGAKPLSPEQCTELNLHNRLAFDNLLSGGSQRDFEVIAALSNLAQIVDRAYFYSRKIVDIEHAQQVIKSCYELSKSRGVYLLTADGMQAVRMLLSLHEAQLQQVTQREMRKAVEHAQKLGREAYRKVAA